MKNLIKLLVLFLSLFLISVSNAGYYDDWSDETICMWLEQRPNHKGYLEENRKRDLKCFEREDFHPRDFVYEPLNLKMY